MVCALTITSFVLQAAGSFLLFWCSSPKKSWDQSGMFISDSNSPTPDELKKDRQFKKLFRIGFALLFFGLSIQASTYIWS